MMNALVSGFKTNGKIDDFPKTKAIVAVCGI
jgi:hypothetical protein